MITLFLISLPVYFVPSVVAGCRHSKNGFAIFILNLFTGWTLIGWIAAFIWACVSPETPTVHKTIPVALPDWDKSIIDGDKKDEKKLDPLLQGYRP